jgi:phosphohistidine phosphatase
MLLYIVRHAWAEQADESLWPDDRGRPLSKEGRKRFAEVVEKLAKREFAPELIVTSPLVRCAETARILAEGLPQKPELVEREELAPGSDLDGLLEWSKRSGGRHEQVAWVGHAPDVGRMAAELVGDGRAAIEFAKGAVAAIEFDFRPAKGAGMLRWLVTAKMLGC